MEPAQNFPKNFLAPSALRSWITNGHRWSTLLREIRSRFSTITTFAPNNCASIAVRRPHGPAPIIRTCSQQDCVSTFQTTNIYICLVAVNSNINMNCSIRTLLHRSISQQFCAQILLYDSQNETDSFPPMILTWSQCLTIIHSVYCVKNYHNWKGEIFTPNLQMLNPLLSEWETKSHANTKQHQKILFCSLQHIQTRWGAHPAYYLWVLQGFISHC